MKKRLLALLLSLCVVMGMLPTVALAEDDNDAYQRLSILYAEGGVTDKVKLGTAYDMPDVGFKVQINPRSGSKSETVYSDGQTLEVDLRDITSAYIKPYIDVTIPAQTPWEEHVYYTFEFHNTMNGQLADDNDLYGDGRELFAQEYLYNRTNTGNTKKLWVTADALSDERLDTSYYQIIVKAYRSNSLGVEDPKKDTLLGTAQANLHVRMTYSKIALDWLDSYIWDEYFIDNDLSVFYDTPENLIEEKLSDYDSTTGYDELEVNWLDNIPVTWALKSGTTWSTEPGAENALTWTAHPDQAKDAEQWEVPEEFELSGDVVFRNPFSVIFRDGETIIKIEYLKNGSIFQSNDFPQVPERPGYTSCWSVESDLTVSANTEVTAIHTPIAYPITYELEGGTNAPENPASYTAEDTIILVQPTRDGYTFVGWTYPGQSEPQKDVTIPAGSTGALTFAAHWQENSGGTHNSYTLSYHTNGGGVIWAESRGYAWTKPYEELPVPVREGYLFDGWYLDSQLTTLVEDDVLVNRSVINLYAGWRKDMGDPDNNGVSGWLNTKEHNAYLNGRGDGTFGPEAEMTRGEVAQMFYNLLLDKDVPVTVAFSDVPADAWYSTAVNTLASLGIVNGVGGQEFAPDRSITRAEFTVIAMRFADGTTDGENMFSDVHADDWFYDQVVGSIQYRWITGYGDGTFRPNHTITRAEVTIIVNRMLDRTADKAFVDAHLDELRLFPDVDRNDWAYYYIVEATNAHGHVKDGGEETWLDIG